MSDRTYVFDNDGGSCGGGNGIWAVLPALLQRQGVDPNLIALCQNRGGNGNGWGGDLFGILLLFILFGAFRNGNGFFGGNNGGGFMPTPQGGVVPMLNNDANTAVILQSVQRNGYDISTLATALNTSTANVQAAINALGTQICNLGNQMGQNTNQIVTAVMQGNNSIISQLCSCCCDLKQLIADFKGDLALQMCQQTNTIQNGINGLAVGQERGFSSIGYATREQTCELKNTINDLKAFVGEKFSQSEFREMQRENQTLRDERTQYQMSALLQQQSRNLIDTIRPCPSPAYITCNPWGCNGQFVGNGYPFGGNGCCGNNNGCGNGCGCN